MKMKMITTIMITSLTTITMIISTTTTIIAITTTITIITFSIEEILQTLTMEFTKDGEIENCDPQDGKPDLNCIPQSKFYKTIIL